MNYKTIELEQGSPEWLAWRKSVITATDCPAILGSSPWSTAFKCWQKKKGLIPEQGSNAAMERGTRLEPQARALFIQETGIQMRPAVVESTAYEFMGASLDGISSDGNIILEIKCGGEKLHNWANDGIIPPYYLDQIQHQLLVTGAAYAYYYSFDGSSGIPIIVNPEPDFLERWLPKARAFLKCMAFDEPPTMTLADYRDMNNSVSWRDAARMYQDIDGSIKILEEQKDALRRKLIEMCEDQSSMGSGVRVMKTLMRGRVSYEDIPEIKGVDLDKYRKASTSSWKVMVDKEKGA